MRHSRSATEPADVRGYKALHGGIAPTARARVGAGCAQGHRVEYGRMHAFEAYREIDDHDGRGPHVDLWRHEFSPKAAPRLDHDARGHLHFFGGRYTVTAHGVEDQPAARPHTDGAHTMYRSFRQNGALATVGTGAISAAKIAGAVVLGLGVEMGLRYGLNYALRPAEGATPATIRQRVMIRDAISGVLLAGLTGAAAMGNMPLTAVVFGVGTMSVVGRNLARTDAGQKFMLALQRRMVASGLPDGAPLAGTGAVDGYGLPAGEAGAFTQAERQLRAVGA